MILFTEITANTEAKRRKAGWKTAGCKSGIHMHFFRVIYTFGREATVFASWFMIGVCSESWLDLRIY